MSKRVFNKDLTWLLTTHIDPQNNFYAVKADESVDLPDLYFELGAAVERLQRRLGNLHMEVADKPGPAHLTAINAAYELFVEEVKPLFAPAKKKPAAKKKAPAKGKDSE
jgi:hypothetical protein